MIDNSCVKQLAALLMEMGAENANVGIYPFPQNNKKPEVNKIVGKCIAGGWEFVGMFVKDISQEQTALFQNAGGAIANGSRYCEYHGNNITFIGWLGER